VGDDYTGSRGPAGAASGLASPAPGPPADAPRYTPQWLALREPADAAARAEALLGPLRAYLAGRPPGARLVVRDLGCGTGSMGRWLAPRLPGPQHWILHDHDPGLLAHAVGAIRGPAAGGGAVTTAAEAGDLALLDADRLAGTSLVTASALLDLLTAGEVDALAAACAEAGCPALLTISVVGRVELDPAEPLDAVLGAAFNDHQRREHAGRRLLGPGAVAAARAAFGGRGFAVRTEPSPWRLGPGEAELIAEWLRGWVGAACEQRPELAAGGEAYLRRRLGECAAGRLRVTVWHEDLLALPGRPAEGGR